MPSDILMPALSPTMTEGKLARWLKQEGDSVEIGDVLAEIETDKATMEVEAIEEGTIGKILIGDGTDNVPVNTRIGILLEEGEDESALKEAESGGGKAEKAEPAPASGGEAGASGGGGGESRAPAAPAEAKPPKDEDEDRWYETSQKQQVREALRDAMAEELRRDGDVFLMGEEVAEYEGAYKVTQGLLAEFGAKRVIDTPITEHAFAGVGVGAGFAKLKPIVEFMTWNFAMQAMDHLINSAAKTLYMSGGQMGCPITFRGPNGPASRVGAQHSQDYASWYSHVPGLKVIAPYSGGDAKGLLKAAIRDPDPVFFLENEVVYGMSFDVPQDPDFTLPIGKAKIVRSGRDVTIVCYAQMVKHSLDAAEQLAEEGIEAEVIDLRTLRPLDRHTVLESIKKTNRLVTAEECWPQSGVGSELATLAVKDGFDYLDAPVERVHQADVPLPYAANLEKLSLPQPDDVIRAARTVCNRA